MRYRALALVTLAVAVAGCASEDAGTGATASRLVIYEKRVFGGPMYIEGSVGFLLVTPAGSSGEAPTEVPTAGPDKPALIYDERVPPGDYRIVSYQRPCDGNCGTLDPPTDRCATTIQVPPGETLRVTIVVRPSHPCRVTPTRA